MSRTPGTPKHQQYHAFRLICAIANNAHPRTKAPLSDQQRRKIVLTVAQAVVADVFRHDYGAHLLPDGGLRRARRRQSLLPNVRTPVVPEHATSSAFMPLPFDARAFRDEQDARLQRMIDQYFVELRQRYPGKGF